MTTLFTRLMNDENGFLVSAELVLIATIAILGIVVGLSEVASSVNNELEDVASAFGAMNQSFHVNGHRSCHKGSKAGSGFSDDADACDSQNDISGTSPESEE
jgi:Flp pilus assembly pilin Flp